MNKLWSEKRKDYYTVMETGKYFGVSPGTVGKWFDEGILAGYRFPQRNKQKGDRRVSRKSIAGLMSSMDMTVPPELREKLLVLLTGTDTRLGQALYFAAMGEPSLELHCATTDLSAGLVYGERKPALVVVDSWMGRREALEMLRILRERADCVCLLGVASEDDTALAEWGMDTRDLFRRPFDPESLVARVKELLVPEAKEKTNARFSA